MVAESPAIDADTFEREIIARLGAAKLRLRFDKVALRLVGGLKAALALPVGRLVKSTVAACAATAQLATAARATARRAALKEMTCMNYS